MFRITKTRLILAALAIGFAANAHAQQPASEVPA